MAAISSGVWTLDVHQSVQQRAEASGMYLGSGDHFDLADVGLGVVINTDSQHVDILGRAIERLKNLRFPVAWHGVKPDHHADRVDLTSGQSVIVEDGDIYFVVCRDDGSIDESAPRLKVERLSELLVRNLRYSIDGQREHVNNTLSLVAWTAQKVLQGKVQVTTSQQLDCWVPTSATRRGDALFLDIPGAFLDSTNGVTLKGGLFTAGLLGMAAIVLSLEVYRVEGDPVCIDSTEVASDAETFGNSAALDQSPANFREGMVTPGSLSSASLRYGVECPIQQHVNCVMVNRGNQTCNADACAAVGGFCRWDTGYRRCQNCNMRGNYADPPCRQCTCVRA